jgi:hypothetical protein
MNIKQNIIDAQILNLGFYTNPEYEETFYKLTTTEGIDLQFDRAIHIYNNGKAPIRYLTYDSTNNTVHLKIVRFSHKNNLWIYDNIITEEDDIEWINVIRNEYVLSYNATSKVGMAYHNLLPVIFRN